MLFRLIIIGMLVIVSVGYSAVPCPALRDLLTRGVRIDGFRHPSLNAIGKKLEATLAGFVNGESPSSVITLLGHHRSGKSVFAGALREKYFSQTGLTVTCGYKEHDLPGVIGAAESIGAGKRVGLLMIEEAHKADPKVLEELLHNINGTKTSLNLDKTVVFL